MPVWHRRFSRRNYLKLGHLRCLHYFAEQAILLLCLWLATSRKDSNVKVPAQVVALKALSRALADASPKVLHGSKGKGIFEGAGQAAKQAAQHCLESGWLEPTGQFEGKGKTKKQLYRITPAGLRQVLEHSEPVTLLSDSLAFLDRNTQELRNIRAKVEETLSSLQNQKTMMDALRERLQPPDVDELLKRVLSANGAAAKTVVGSVDWLPTVLEYLENYQRRNPYGHCPLPELFHRVAEHRGLTIGQFHDGLRQLVQQRQIRLHAFSGAAYQLEEEHYALVAGQEIKYYAERVTKA
jgi:hypothetical protein